MLTDKDIEELLYRFLSGKMSPEEEEAFKQQLAAAENLRSDAATLTFLVKSIRRIREKDASVVDAAKDFSESDIKSLFDYIYNEEYDERIDSYLSGKMSDEEEAVFEESLKNDKKFRERAEVIAMLVKGVRNEQNRTQRAIEDAGKLSAESVISAAAAQPADMWTFRKVVAAAAVLLLLFSGVGYGYYARTAMLNCAGDVIAMSVSDLSGDYSFMRGSQDSALITDLRLLLDNVANKKDLSATIGSLERYYQVATDEYANEEDTYVNQISLALATAYIYNGQKSEAKNVLNHLITDKYTPASIKEQAQKLLDCINKSFIF